MSPKVTKPGWPDPNEWFNGLFGKLATAHSKYIALTDATRQRNLAARVLGDVIESLREFPPLKDGYELVPLKDLMIFLADLENGRLHPWNKGVIGTNISSRALNELKLYVRAVNALLARCGYGPVEAYRRIAAGLTKSGRAGRLSSKLPWQTVQKWCLAEETRHDAATRERLERWWDNYCADLPRCPTAEPRRGMILKQRAGKFADKLWSTEFLRDRLVSI